MSKGATPETAYYMPACFIHPCCSPQTHPRSCEQPPAPDAAAVASSAYFSAGEIQTDGGANAEGHVAHAGSQITTSAHQVRF